jgi:putative transposase
MLAVRLGDSDEHPESATLLRTMIHRIAAVMIEQVLEAEVEAYLLKHRDVRDVEGHALVVRNGKSRRRTLATSLGNIGIRAPRVHDRRTGADGRRERFVSRVLPAYVRSGPSSVERLPPLYLSGLATGDFSPVAVAIAGTDESGSLWSTIGSLIASWEADYRMWREHRLEQSEYTYVWVGSIASGLADDRPATLLVAIGMRSSGAIELVGVRHGVPGSVADWTPLLDDARERGMSHPSMAVGYESLGFWDAAAAVWPAVDEPKVLSERVVIAPGLTPARHLRAHIRGDL